MIVIQAFELSHLRSILRIEKGSFPSEPYTREIFLDVYNECRGMFFVARRRARIIAYIATSVTLEKAEIISIAVRPSFRKAGVGTALVEYTLDLLAERGVPKVFLMVGERNKGAISFYRRLGFRSVRRVEDYYRDGEAAIRMRKIL